MSIWYCMRTNRLINESNSTGWLKNRENDAAVQWLPPEGQYCLFWPRLSEVDPARLLAWAVLCSILPKSANHSALLIYSGPRFLDSAFDLDIGTAKISNASFSVTEIFWSFTVCCFFSNSLSLNITICTLTIVTVFQVGRQFRLCGSSYSLGLSVAGRKSEKRIKTVKILLNSKSKIVI